MAYQSRTRKRVNALCRAPDGSAFQNCKSCGVSVAIALVDMHECESKTNVKKSKVEKEDSQIKEEQRFQDEPRSEFRFFMESFVKNCDTKNLIEMDRLGFETWKNMSSQEKRPYKLQAKTVNDAYYEKLLKESEDQMCSSVDDEADSAEVGKFDKNPRFYNEESSESDSYDSDSYDADEKGNGSWW